MNTYLLDTNIIMRFLRDDDPAQSPKAQALFASAATGQCVLLLSPLVITESVWVLKSFYKVERNAIADSLSALIRRRGISCEAEEIVADALACYGSTNLDIVDCFLVAQAKAASSAVATFDEGIRRLQGAEIWESDAVQE